MLVCPGCGGRNTVDADTCSFCMRRLGAQPRRSRALRGRVLGSILVVAVVILATVASVMLALHNPG